MRRGRMVAELEGDADHREPRSSPRRSPTSLRKPLHDVRRLADAALDDARADARRRACASSAAAGSSFRSSILFLTLSLVSEPFATKANLLHILDQQSATLIIAAAGTLVLVAGGIDLSVGAVYGFAAVTAGALRTPPQRRLRDRAGDRRRPARRAAQRNRRHRPPDQLADRDAGDGLHHQRLLVDRRGWEPARVLRQKRVRRTSRRRSSSASRPRSGRCSPPWSPSGCCLRRRSRGATCTRPEATPRRPAWPAYASTGPHPHVRDQRYGRGPRRRDRHREGADGAGPAERHGAHLHCPGRDRRRAARASSGGEGAVWRSVVGVLFIALIGNGYLLLALDPLYQQITLGVLLLAAVALDALSRRRP